MRFSSLVVVFCIIGLGLMPVIGCTPSSSSLPLPIMTESPTTTHSPESTSPTNQTTSLITETTKSQTTTSSPDATTSEPTRVPAQQLSSYIIVSGDYVAGSTISIDASRLETVLGTALNYLWSQVLPPDKYTGVEYITGNMINIATPTNSLFSFTPEWPGNYRFKLDISGDKVREEVSIDVPVRLKQSPFAIRGIAYDMWHYSDELAYMSEEFVRQAKESGANLVMLSPTLYMASPMSNDMSTCPSEVGDEKICRGAMKDEALIKMIREAHTAGLQVMVKMILKVATPDGSWVEKKPANWDEWFKNWTDVCLHYGQIAEREGVEYYAVGSELRESAEYVENWYKLIKTVRGVYSGKLTYGDNSISEGLTYGDYGYFKAWDALDYIGIHFYGKASGVYGIPMKNDPSVEEMASSIEHYFAEVLDPIVKKYNKPVIVMEFGAASYDGTNLYHFNYNQVLDNAEQAEYYEAGLQVMSTRDYIQGVNIWAYTWEPFDLADKLTMSPIRKPAGEVISLWFQGK